MSSCKNNIIFIHTERRGSVADQIFMVQVKSSQVY